MSRRISVPRGLQDLLTSTLTRRLMGIKNNYFWNLMSKERAKEQGRLAIEDEFRTLLRVGRDRVRYALGRVSELPPEERARLERWRNEYVADFGNIIDGVKRAGE